jgi:ABC-type glycerol-3-phosphate transport system substrate-binding protein/DNA-binding transcriptional regulator YhcF (GntR family)
MSVDPTQPIPIYFQLKTLLLEEILEGRYGSDGRLPTEHELCERFEISRTPVTRALSELAEEGVILRHRRRGTFVNPHGLRRRPEQPEVRVVVSESIWGRLVADAAPDGTRVNVVTVPLPELHHALTHAVAEGRAPDLAIVDSVWIAEFAAAGFLHALEDLDDSWVRTEHDGDFLEPLVSSNRADGRTFGVSPFGSLAGIWYRRRELEALNLEPPETWDELRTVARALAENGTAAPLVLPGGSKGGETTAYCLVAFLASNGATVLSEAGIVLDSPETAQTLEFLRSLIGEGLVPADVVGYEWTQPVHLLAGGKAGMSVGGSYEARYLAEALGVSIAELWDHVGFVAVPAGPVGRPASVAGSMSYAIFRQAAQPQLAMNVLKSAVAPPVLARLARSTGRFPGRRSAVGLAAPHVPFVSESAQLLRHAVTRPKIPLYPRVSTQLQAMLEAALTGRLEPRAAASRAAEHIEAITGLRVVRSTVQEPVAAH